MGCLREYDKFRGCQMSAVSVTGDVLDVGDACHTRN